MLLVIFNFLSLSFFLSAVGHGGDGVRRKEADWWGWAALVWQRVGEWASLISGLEPVEAEETLLKELFLLELEITAFLNQISWLWILVSEVWAVWKVTSRGCQDPWYLYNLKSFTVFPEKICQMQWIIQENAMPSHSPPLPSG